MRLSGRRWLALAITAVIVLDWLTKFWVQNRMFLGSVRSLVDGWVWLQRSQNPGIAMSRGASLPAAIRTPLIAAVAFAGILVVGHLVRTSRDAWTRAAAALVLAGAIGNLGDRLLDGMVTDFIVIRFFPYVFSVADIAITLGAVVLAARMALVDAALPDSATPTPG
jgi:signal peptidase II